jgi:hypothetical protein
MFEKLKTMMQPAAGAGENKPRQLLSSEAQAALALEVRFLLRNMLKAEEFPYLSQLGQATGIHFDRTQIPVSALPGLAQEIEAIRHKLPAQSPLLKLADSVRGCRGMDLVLAPAGEGAATAPGQEARDAADRELADSTPLSATAKLQVLKSAAAGVDVAEISTSQMSEPEQAAYFKYCLGLGDYETIIATLRPRAPNEHRVWVWGLLVAAMRLSGHPDFSAVVAEYQAWMVAHHPETLNDMTVPGEKRKFNGARIAELEAQELAAN